MTRATVARNSMTVAEPAAVLLNFCGPCFSPPAKQDRPNTSSRLPMMLPVIDALTTPIWWARSAAIAMMSSAALPNEALRNPPRVGPARRARCSVAVPMSPAAGTERQSGRDEDPSRGPLAPVQPEAEGGRQEQQVQPACGDHRLELGERGRHRTPLCCGGPQPCYTTPLRFPEPVARPDVPGICSRPHKAVTRENGCADAV